MRRSVTYRTTFVMFFATFGFLSVGLGQTKGLRGSPSPFVRGDVDRSGEITISDAIRILQFLYLGQSAPPLDCPAAADVNADGRLDESDSVQLLRFVLAEGEAPPPLPAPGIDPFPSGLGCSPFDDWLLADAAAAGKTVQRAGDRPRRRVDLRAPFAPRQLILGFRPGVTEDQIAAFYAEHELDELEDLDSDSDDDDPDAVLIAVGAEVTKELIEKLTRDPDLEFAEPNYRLYADLMPTDPMYGDLWGLNNTGQTGGTSDADIDAPEAWDTTTGASSVVIAVVDTGVYTSHVDLNANIWVNPGETPGDGIDNDGNGYVDDVNGWNFFDNNNQLWYSASEDNHGTHVSGTVAATGDNGVGVVGVNWQAQVMVLKFIGPGGSGFTSDAISAIQYATDKGAKVINASWGGGGSSQALKNAIEACNCVFAAAAGNGGPDEIGDDTDVIPHYPSSFDSDNIIAVAATDHNDQRTVFSNYGATSVDLGAPGLSILSTISFNNYAWFSGTSMATPHVSGVAGLIYGQSPGLTPTQVKGQILSAVA